MDSWLQKTRNQAAVFAAERGLWVCCVEILRCKQTSCQQIEIRLEEAAGGGVRCMGGGVRAGKRGWCRGRGRRRTGAAGRGWCRGTDSTGVGVVQETGPSARGEVQQERRDGAGTLCRLSVQCRGRGRGAAGEGCGLFALLTRSKLSRGCVTESFSPSVQ